VLAVLLAVALVAVYQQQHAASVLVCLLLVLATLKALSHKRRQLSQIALPIQPFPGVEQDQLDGMVDLIFSLFAAVFE